MSDLYTCITCRIAFKDGDSQRQHYKSDWHRYNLKRKVAELPPITAEEFIKRVLAQRNETEESTKDKSKYCESCRKSFNNEKSFDNHLNSKKHKDNAVHKFETLLDSKLTKEQIEDVPAVPEDPAESEASCEEVDSDEWEDDFDNPTINHVCLFCAHRSRSLVRSFRHMSLEHSFFIPDVEFCINLQGLINYLGEKVYNGFMCLWCNDTGKAFHSAEAAQGHMRDKGHCKILHEGAVLIEYADYYDYSSSYPDGHEAMDVDEEINVPIIDGTDYQLVLPSGAVIGHRSLSRYYKQKLDPNSAVVAVPKSGKALHKVLAQYKALGWTGTKREVIVKKARDINYMHRVRNKWTAHLSFKANKLQPHFRRQVNF